MDLNPQPYPDPRYQGLVEAGSGPGWATRDKTLRCVNCSRPVGLDEDGKPVHKDGTGYQCRDAAHTPLPTYAELPRMVRYPKE